MKKNTKKMTKMLTGGVLATSLLSPVVASPLTVHAATSASVSDSQSQLPKFTSFTDLPGISDNAYSATKATVSAKTIDNGIIAIQWNGYTNWRDNLVKIDASGKIVSRAVLPDKDFVAKGITQAPDGNFIVVGSTYDWGWNRNWNVITKFDVNGHQIWSTNVPIDMGIGINAVAKTSDGNYIGVGPHGWTKFDDNGKVIWTNFDTQAFTLTSATPTSDGGVIAAGYLASHGSKTSVIVRIDGKGNEVWKKYFNPSVENAFNGIAPTSDGGFVVSGIDREWDLMGMVELQNMTQTETKYGGKKVDSQLASVSSTSDGFLVGAMQRSLIPAIIKYDNNGNKQWLLNNTSHYASNYYDLSARNVSQILLISDNEFVALDGYGFNHYNGGGNSIQSINTSLNQLKTSLNQADLDKVMALINALPDSTPEKATLLLQAKAIQAQIDVKTLTSSVNQADLTNLTTVNQLQTKIDSVSASVNQYVTDATLKANLLQQIVVLQEKVNEAKGTLMVVDAENTASAGLTTLDSVTLAQGKVDTATDFINNKVTDKTVQSTLNQRLAVVQEKINEGKATILTGQAENDLTSDSVTLAQSAIDTVKDTTVKDSLQARLNVVKQVIQATDDTNKLKDSLSSFEKTLNQTDLSKANFNNQNVLDRLKNIFKGNYKPALTVMDTLKASLKDIQTQADVVAKEVTALPDSTVATIVQRKADLNTQVNNVQQVSNVLKAILDANSIGGQNEHGNIESALQLENEHNKAMKSVKPNVNYLLAREAIHLSANKNLYDVTMPVLPSKENIKANGEQSASATTGSIFEKNHFANDGIAPQPKTVILGSILTDKLGAKQDIHFLSVNHSLATMDDQGNTTLQYKTLTVHGKEVKLLLQGMDNLIAYSSKGYIDIYTLINQGHSQPNEK